MKKGVVIILGVVTIILLIIIIAATGPKTAVINITVNHDGLILVKFDNQPDWQELGQGQASFKTQDAGNLVVRVQKGDQKQQRALAAIPGETENLSFNLVNPSEFVLEKPGQHNQEPLSELSLIDKVSMIGINPYTQDVNISSDRVSLSFLESLAGGTAGEIQPVNPDSYLIRTLDGSLVLVDNQNVVWQDGSVVDFSLMNQELFLLNDSSQVLVMDLALENWQPRVLIDLTNQSWEQIVASKDSVYVNGFAIHDEHGDHPHWFLSRYTKEGKVLIEDFHLAGSAQLEELPNGRLAVLTNYDFFVLDLESQTRLPEYTFLEPVYDFVVTEQRIYLLTESEALWQVSLEDQLFKNLSSQNEQQLPLYQSLAFLNNRLYFSYINRDYLQNPFREGVLGLRGIFYLDI